MKDENRFQIRMYKEERELLEQLAEMDDRNLSAEVRVLIRAEAGRRGLLVKSKKPVKAA